MNLHRPFTCITCKNNFAAHLQNVSSKNSAESLKILAISEVVFVLSRGLIMWLGQKGEDVLSVCNNQQQAAKYLSIPQIV